MRKTFWALPLAVLLVSCGPKEAAQTGDETRSAAGEVRPGTTVDDKVSSSNDPVDWKRFDVERKTDALITIYWDNPKIQAEVNLRDMFGNPVASATHASGATKDQISTNLKDGTWFLEIKAKSGASVYTLEVILGGETTSNGVPRPE